MFIIAMSIFYFLTSIITTIFFIRKKYSKNNNSIIKYLLLFLSSIVIYFILLTFTYYACNTGIKTINIDCKDVCIYTYTNNNIQIFISLVLSIAINVAFYYIFKKSFINIYSSKFKYLILISYIVVQYSGILFGILTFFGFRGYFEIKNIIVNILRYIIVYLPIIIYPIDILLLDKIKKQD